MEPSGPGSGAPLEDGDSGLFSKLPPASLGLLDRLPGPTLGRLNLPRQ